MKEQPGTILACLSFYNLFKRSALHNVKHLDQTSNISLLSLHDRQYTQCLTLTFYSKNYKLMIHFDRLLQHPSKFGTENANKKLNKTIIIRSLKVTLFKLWYPCAASSHERASSYSQSQSAHQLMSCLLSVLDLQWSDYISSVLFFIVVVTSFKLTRLSHNNSTLFLSKTIK